MHEVQEKPSFGGFFGRLSLSSKMRLLLVGMLVPMALVVAVLVYALLMNSAKYDNIVSNLTIASEFSFDFKNTVDYNTYRYIIVKKDFDSFGLLKDIEQARGVVSRLQQTSTKPDSLNRLKTIHQDLDKLEEGVIEIRDERGYDFLMMRLDTNVRVLTSLIQDRIWEYVYHETANLDEMISRTNAETTRIAIILSLAAGVVIFFVYLLAMRVAGSITKPIKELSRNIGKVGKGDFTVRPLDTNDDEVGTLSAAFDDMVAQIGVLMENVRQEQDNLRLAEFRLLQAQINPHFLYNTFDTAIWLAQDNQNEQVIKIISSLSNFFRTSLSKGQDIITLREEALHVRSYLEIQQMRYQDLLRYEIDIPEEMGDYTLPKLTLQPLVENALYHGIKRKRSLGLIKITASLLPGGGMQFSVWDNGIGMQPQELAALRTALTQSRRQSFGLPNVYERLQLYYQNNCTITIQSKYGVYTEILVLLPTKEIQLIS